MVVLTVISPRRRIVVWKQNESNCSGLPFPKIVLEHSNTFTCCCKRWIGELMIVMVTYRDLVICHNTPKVILRTTDKNLKIAGVAKNFIFATMVQDMSSHNILVCFAAVNTLFLSNVQNVKKILRNFCEARHLHVGLSRQKQLFQNL